jgi:hypothetical protein
MTIVVTQKIKKRELRGFAEAEPKKLFDKLKGKRDLAVPLSSPGLPPNATLYKIYATSAGGARRLLFFCCHKAGTSIDSERWVLLFYRKKGDEIGDNMSVKNQSFTPELLKNLQFAVDDIATSTPEDPKYEEF